MTQSPSVSIYTVWLKIIQQKKFRTMLCLRKNFVLAKTFLSSFIPSAQTCPLVGTAERFRPRRARGFILKTQIALMLLVCLFYDSTPTYHIAPRMRTIAQAFARLYSRSIVPSFAANTDSHFS